jgi:hypothetical protein
MIGLDYDQEDPLINPWIARASDVGTIPANKE